MRKLDTGTCDHCHGTFGYYLIHNGFNESAHSYCVDCGRTGLVSLYGVPKEIHLIPGPITPKAKDFLMPCSCGGLLSGEASPRCPHCGQRLSAEDATLYIEFQAEGPNLAGVGKGLGGDFMHS